MIEMGDIVKIYKNGMLELRALDGITLSVQKGEFVAVVGASGSGKTTLMNIMGCIDRPTEGRYFLDGEDVLSCSGEELAKVRNRKIGFVFQRFNLLPKFDALTNVEIPLIYRGVERSISRKKAARLLDMVGLGDRLRHRPNELSGGQQQRVAIARALIGDPPLILADEPTGNLDTKSSGEIMQLFKELNARGHTIVLITHNPEIAQESNRIIYIKDGRITREEEREKPSDEESAFNTRVAARRGA